MWLYISMNKETLPLTFGKHLSSYSNFLHLFNDFGKYSEVSTELL